MKSIIKPYTNLDIFSKAFQLPSLPLRLLDRNSCKSLLAYSEKIHYKTQLTVWFFLSAYPEYPRWIAPLDPHICGMRELTSMHRATERYHPVFTGVFFVSMAVLSLQVILTRIFSFSIWYHFAYLTINMALLGFGSSGALLASFPKITDKGGHRLLVIVSLISAALMLVVVFTFARYPLQPQTILTRPLHFSLSLLLYYGGVTLPFFFAGMAIALSLTLYAEQVSYFYFWDLSGAALGALISLLLINWLGAPGGVMVCALFMLVAAGFFAAQTSRRLTALLLMVSLGLCITIPYLKNRISFIPCNSKALARVYNEPHLFQSLFSQWNAINRVDVYRDTDDKSLAPFLSWVGMSSAYRGGFPRIYDMQYDAHNGSNIFQFNGDLNEFAFLDYHLLKTPYLVTEKPRVLIIGVGGGIDVLNAFRNSASSITAVELQPIAVSLLKDRFSEWTGNLFNDYPQITLIAAEGRNFIKQDKKKYDLIQITATDTFAALTTGAYVLMESYLYTEEAIADYYEHLDRDGVLCIVVGDHIIEGEEVLQPLNSRLMVQYLNVLQAKGIADPRRHLAILGKQETFLNIYTTCPLLKKTPFTEEEMIALRSFAEKMNFEMLYDPLGAAKPTILSSIIFADREERRQIIERVSYNIAPCRDNNPFFYNFNKWGNILDIKRFFWFTPVYGQLVLIVMLLQSVALAILFVILPLLVSPKTRIRVNKAWGYLFYFFALGIGFMFIEISFIQKFVLFLGYPAYAFAITIFSLLLFSGAGSYWTGRIVASPEKTIKKITPALAALLLAYSFGLSPLFDRFIGEGFFLKVLITILTQLPLGFLLGMFFPLGIKVVRRVDVRMVPWAWGVNGLSSVISTVLAIILAMSFGFTVVAVLAALVYLLGMASLLAVQRRCSTTAR